MPTVVVIGSNCFTGSHIVAAFLEDPENRVIGVSRSRDPDPVFLPYRNSDLSRFEFRRIDIVRNFDDLTALLATKQPEIVVNVAALSEVGLSNFQPAEYYAINTVAVVRLVDYLRQCDWLDRYVHISSAEIYGSCDEAITEDRLFNPSTPYAVSKAAGDMHVASAIRQFGFPAFVVRSTNVFGAHQQLFKIIPRTVIYVKLGRPIELHGGGLAMKSFVHIRDVVRGLVLGVTGGKTGVYHFSVASERTVADTVRAVCDRMSVPFGDATRTVGERPGQDQRYWLDCTKAERELGWRPEITFETGVDETVRWVEKNWDTISSLPLEYQHKV